MHKPYLPCAVDTLVRVATLCTELTHSGLLSATAQVEREHRWKQRRQQRDAAIINRQRAKPPSHYSWETNLLQLPGTDTSEATVPARQSSAASSSSFESSERPGSRVATAASTRPPTPPWQQKRNKFLENRVVVDRFKKGEDLAEAAARRRREAVTADFRDKDRPFQDVLDACLFGTAAERAAEAAKALRRLRRGPRGLTAPSSGREVARGEGARGGGGGTEEGATLLPQLGDGGGGAAARAASPTVQLDTGDSASAWAVDDVLNSHGYSLLGQAVVDKNHNAVRFLVEAKASVGLHDGNGAYLRRGTKAHEIAPAGGCTRLCRHSSAFAQSWSLIGFSLRPPRSLPIPPPAAAAAAASQRVAFHARLARHCHALRNRPDCAAHRRAGKRRGDDAGSAEPARRPEPPGPRHLRG